MLRHRCLLWCNSKDANRQNKHSCVLASMGIYISKEIAYWTESVACFDPEKVLGKLVEAFPQVQIDPTDYAEEELNRIRQFAQEHIESEERRLNMIRQITGKARRNGPGYHFTCEVKAKRSLKVM
jgi:hypothetical protein